MLRTMSATADFVGRHPSRELELDRYDIEVVVPVYNEERELDANVRRLRRYLDEHLPFSTLVTIADNASTDSTPVIAQTVADELAHVRVVRLDRKGRGRALRSVWSASEASVVAYMDLDLSTGLDALLPLVAPLISRHSDVAIGSRLAPGSHVVRGPRREAISRIYNRLLRTCFRTQFSDAQCGFKAVRTDVARVLMPLIEDDAWFFDTELLILAEHNGFRIHEVPVDWIDDADSRVDVAHTALADLAGMWRMARRIGARRAVEARAVSRAAPVDGVTAELVRFVAIGSGSTIAFFALFLALRAPLGALGANAVALVLCSVGNRAAHRRATTASTAGTSLAGFVARTLSGFAVSVAFTTAALAIAGEVSPSSVPLDVAVLIPATAAATVVRFSIWWRELARTRTR